MLPNDTEMALRYKDCHLIVLRGFQDPRGYGPLWTARQVLKVLADLPAEIRFNFEGIDILIRAHLITMREFDLLLAQVSSKFRIDFRYLLILILVACLGEFLLLC